MAQVTIINTAIETIDLLREVLEDEGFVVAADYVARLKSGESDINALFSQHQPDAVIYDVAIPYEENWNFLQQVIIPASNLPTSAFVITTTNKAVLERLVGATSAIEMIGKPFDLEEIVTAVKRAVQR
jgi:DNA-binding NtrC family response regulator